MRESVRGYGSSSYGGSTARKNFNSGYAAAKKNPGKKTTNEMAGYKEGYKAGQASVKTTAKRPPRSQGKLSISEKLTPANKKPAAKKTVAKKKTR